MGKRELVEVGEIPITIETVIGNLKKNSKEKF